MARVVDKKRVHAKDARSKEDERSQRNSDARLAVE